MNAVMRYSVPSLFSWRTLTANSFAARTLPCPTPAGVKLAMLGILLRRDGHESGQDHLRWLAPLAVAWHPAHRMAVKAATVRIWKQGEKPDDALTSSVGMREYVHSADPFSVALMDVPSDRMGDAAYALEHVRSLGNAESLVQPGEPVNWVETLPPGFVLLQDGLKRGDVAALLDDLGPDASFERLSVYRAPGKDTVPPTER